MKFACTWALLGMLSALEARRLPVKTYTTADGLASDSVGCAVQDRRGFLWICTPEGLSRFDGYRFTNYRTEQGLPGNFVTAFLETREGAFWVGTKQGLARFDPAATPAKRFVRYLLPGDARAQLVYVLREDRIGAVWCGTFRGLFRLAKGGASFERVEGQFHGEVRALLIDRLGALWIATYEHIQLRVNRELYRRDPNGRTIQIVLPTSPAFASLLEDHEGRIWIGTDDGLWRINGMARPVHWFSKEVARDLLQSSDGRIWIGLQHRLAEWIPGTASSPEHFEFYGVANGVSEWAALTEDRDRNLWLGRSGTGLVRMARSGLVTYSGEDGIRGLPTNVGAFFETRQGELCFFNQSVIHRFDGRRFRPIRPAFPRDINYFSIGVGSMALQDRDGDWWIATGQGLCRFPPMSLDKLSRIPPKAIYRTADGLIGDNIFQIFEDSRGDMWIGIRGSPWTRVTDSPQNGLARWERSTGHIHNFLEVEGFQVSLPAGFAEDRAGNIWVGCYNGYLARYHDGKFTMFTNEPGVPPGGGKVVYVDSAGRLWVGSWDGLGRSDNPNDARPQFVTYSTSHGLASNFILSITEDRWGRIYVATLGGVDRLTPRAGGIASIQHFTVADGLAAGELKWAFRDRKGDLWFATNLGLSQFTPTADRPVAPPPILVTSLQVGTDLYPVADIGATAVQGPRLKPGQGTLRIDFVGLSFAPGEMLRYQYRLEGADREWSAPTDHRTVAYGRLSSGRYRFQVRAINSEGMMSPEPANVDFTMLPPVWLSWWFISAAAMGTIGLIYAAHRYRVRQILAVERVRSQIATDLHDDIGSSLTQISILSELVRQRLNTPDPQVSQPLREIATVSREMVASLSDIVWAINPRQDRLHDLVARMRRFALDVLGGRGIELRFETSEHHERLHTSAEFRRQVYLIFKEAINNVARHAGCTRAVVRLGVGDGRLQLEILDNGNGFEPTTAARGNGMRNMQRRAAELHGALELRSGPGGSGTQVKLNVPISEPRTSRGPARIPPRLGGDAGSEST
jgi:ligand-binding sensor domain-containing protein/two-component sensor histidine kinase